MCSIAQKISSESSVLTGIEDLRVSMYLLIFLILFNSLTLLRNSEQFKKPRKLILAPPNKFNLWIFHLVLKLGLNGLLN